jgi:hypothetical protein
MIRKYDQTVQRAAIKRELESVIKRAGYLRPSHETQALHDALDAAYHALRQAQCKYDDPQPLINVL